MEKRLQNKKESGISRTVGVDAETERAILDFFKRQFEQRTRSLTEKEHPKEFDEMIITINGFFKEISETLWCDLD